jgi:hypothetical protein
LSPLEAKPFNEEMKRGREEYEREARQRAERHRP